MAELDHGVKLIAATAGRALARLAGVECSSWGPLESTLQATTERLSDRVFVAARGRERFVVYFEFYSAWDADARWDMLGKSGLLSQREHLPTVCVAVMLQRRGCRPLNGPFQLTAARRPTQALWARDVCLWQTTPEPWWDGVPGLMPLYPLTRHGRKPRGAVEHASGVIERQVPGGVGQADLLALLGIFGQVAYPGLDLDLVIGREKMKESRFYQNIFHEGEQAGEIKARRATVLEILSTRFGAASEALAPAVNAIEDLAQLTELVRLAVRCKRLEEFRRAVPAAAPLTPRT